MTNKNLVITSPNSAYQGTCPYISENPYHEIIQKYNFIYTHTTIINHSLISEVEYAIHTYRYEKTGWVISVKATNNGYFLSSHKVGSSAPHTTILPSRLEKYLKRKVREIKRREVL